MFRKRYQTLSTPERRAFWIALAVTITVFLFGITLIDTLVNAPNLQYRLVNLSPYLLALIGLVSAFLILFGKVEVGSWLMQIGTLVFLLVNTTQAEGYPYLAAFVVLVITLYIPVQTLKGRNATVALWIGISGAIGIILLDAFWTGERVPALQRDVIFAAIFSSILALILIFTTAQQFASYTFRTKLILFFVIVAIFSVTTAAVVANTLARNEITRQVSTNQQAVAENLATLIGRDIESQIEILQTAASQFGNAADIANTSYKVSELEIRDRNMELDQEWITAPDTAALVLRILNNRSAVTLRQLRSDFPRHAEFIVTDKYGANVAATSRTSDYFQADEDWWQSAYASGAGGVYVGQPEFDESTQTYAVNLAVPIWLNGSVVGVLRSTYDVSAIIDILQHGSSSENSNVELLVSSNTLLNGEKIAQEELPGLGLTVGQTGEVVYQGEPSLVSQQRIFAPSGSIGENIISRLGWSIIVYEGLESALQPVQQQTRAITLISIIITAMVSLLGYYASQRLVSPIINLTEVTKKISGGDLSIRADIPTRDEIGELADSFNRMTGQLQDTLGGLERRVSERTTDLDMARLISERRAQELQSISEISRTISTEQSLEILLPLITRLVSDRFEFYHVGIFFMDEARQYAYLQAANSEGGKRMLAREHRLEVGTGLVGTVAQTGKPRIALDVGSDAAFFDNPDLPRTRSEMALPLATRGQLIGVLDVQSTKPGAFTESDANTLGILADQIAIAIENARLFGQTQQAREEAEKLYAQILRQEWSAFNAQEARIGYRQTATGGKLLTKPVTTEEILQALENGQVVVVEGRNGRSQSSIAIPLKLRGNTIGVLNIKAPNRDRRWSQDEINLAQSISDRLALALDNVRLLQESQRRAAKEAKIGEVSAKIGASINMRNVLQTAVEELGRALPGAEVVIQFEKAEK
jgi:GAF domain-containing protein/HAMP domain-containing protein